MEAKGKDMKIAPITPEDIRIKWTKFGLPDFPKNKIGGGSGREPVRVTLDVSRSKFV